MRHLLLLLAGLAQGQALFAAEPPATADLAARYATTVCGQPCDTPHTRQWYFWRGANRVEIRDAGNALGELWKRDGRGRLSYTYLEPAAKRGIEYNPTDLKIIGQTRSWPRLAGVVDPADLAKLEPAGETEVLGHKAVVYRGALEGKQTEIVWLPDLALAARASYTSPQGRTVSELQAFLSGPEAPLPLDDSRLADFQLVDFTDVGDMETSPPMAWLKQARAAPGHEHHDH